MFDIWIANVFGFGFFFFSSGFFLLCSETGGKGRGAGVSMNPYVQQIVQKGGVRLFTGFVACTICSSKLVFQCYALSTNSLWVKVFLCDRFFCFDFLICERVCVGGVGGGGEHRCVCVCETMLTIQHTLQTGAVRMHISQYCKSLSLPPMQYTMVCSLRLRHVYSIQVNMDCLSVCFYNEVDSL